MAEDSKFSGVLVIDDEPLVLRYTTSVISGLGYKNVFRAATAEAARALLAAEPISLIIADVSLPDGDGRQLIAEALRRQGETAAVLITGFSAADLKLPPELAGHVSLLQKPFTADDITQVVADLIEKRSGIAASRAA
jgi:DNA-binding NtrC family response regulator